MLIENSNSDVQLLVLARPADSLCAILTPVLRQWRYAYSVYSNVYDVVNAVRTVPAGRPTVLVMRPAMLSPQAASFLEQHFPNLRMIGWLDSGESVPEQAVTQTMFSGMLSAGGLDHLGRLLHTVCRTIPADRSVPDASAAAVPDKSGKLKCEISNDEIDALLGVQ